MNSQSKRNGKRSIAWICLDGSGSSLFVCCVSRNADAGRRWGVSGLNRRQHSIWHVQAVGQLFFSSQSCATRNMPDSCRLLANRIAGFYCNSIVVPYELFPLFGAGFGGNYLAKPTFGALVEGTSAREGRAQSAPIGQSRDV